MTLPKNNYKYNPPPRREGLHLGARWSYPSWFGHQKDHGLYFSSSSPSTSYNQEKKRETIKYMPKRPYSFKYMGQRTFLDRIFNFIYILYLFSFLLLFKISLQDSWIQKLLNKYDLTQTWLWDQSLFDARISLVIYLTKTNVNGYNLSNSSYNLSNSSSFC